MVLIKGLLILFLLLCVCVVFTISVESKDKASFITSILVGAMFILNIIVLMFV